MNVLELMAKQLQEKTDALKNKQELSSEEMELLHAELENLMKCMTSEIFSFAETFEIIRKEDKNDE